MKYRDTIPGLDEMIEQRYISAREHPSAPFLIYNYTAKAQFDNLWNEATTQCRGLILDTDGNLVARPFRKFFNLGQGDATIPDGPCRVWEKYDGSLGVLYFVDGRPAIASRGSFTSDQALKGTAILEDKYRAVRLDPDYTYLFEIIYPENRIVVDYGDREDLILLAKIHTQSGTEFLPEDIGFPVAEQHTGERTPWEWLGEVRENAEGFVLHWPERNYRLKVKHAEYVRLHRIVTGVSQKAVWEMLRDSGIEAVTTLATKGTPGFAAWLTETATDLIERHATVCATAEQLRFEVPDGDRKTQALAILKMPNPQLLFAMLDGKPWRRMAWELVKPKRSFETYRKDSEE